MRDPRDLSLGGWDDKKKWILENNELFLFSVLGLSFRDFEAVWAIFNPRLAFRNSGNGALSGLDRNAGPSVDG